MNESVPEARPPQEAGARERECPTEPEPEGDPGFPAAPDAEYTPVAPSALDVPRTPTGSADVDGTLARLAHADHLATDGHVEVYEDVHRGLRDTLTALDARPGPPRPYDPRS